ncbi:MAG: hypothetical protein HY794_09745 [Desulfarculus sp.]|nr:hypothetical protein [Desulfarculus sp.]
MKTVLFISYIFPPAGGAGVQRALKFVKYLGSHGWRSVVLTPDRPSVPVLDPSLARDLPPGQVVRRLPSCEPPAPAEASTSGAAQGAGLLTRLKAADFSARVSRPREEAGYGKCWCAAWRASWCMAPAGSSATPPR